MQNKAQQSEKIADGRVGKQVGDHVYVHVSAFSALAPEQQLIITQASELARLTTGDHFNVVKLHQQGDECSLLPSAPSNGIQRHLTALSRYNFSAPVQALSRHGLVRPELTFFDYGCVLIRGHIRPFDSRHNEAT